MKQLPTTPAFCVIAPTAYLTHYATQSNRHLVLAHLVSKDPAYAEFYRHRSLAGDFIIMDNGAFELGGSYAPEKLISLGQMCGADAIVLPDYPFQPSSVTVEAAEKWAPMIKDAGFRTMFVPQSETGDIDGWTRSYVWAGHNGDIDIVGMSILGIPNAMPHIPVPYARVVMTQVLYSQGMFAAGKYHHYLGLNASPNVELPSLLTLGALNSCDSSNPVWTGINGLKYNTVCDSYLPVSKKYIREVDFGEHLSKKLHIHQAIQHNIDITLDIFKNPSAYL